MQEVEKWAASKGIYFVKTSSITGENIEQSFFTLASFIDIERAGKPKVMSSFACSYSSGPNKTEATKEAEVLSYKNMSLQQNMKGAPPPAMSFFLSTKKETDRKKRNCCKN